MEASLGTKYHHHFPGGWLNFPSAIRAKVASRAPQESFGVTRAASLQTLNKGPASPIPRRLPPPSQVAPRRQLPRKGKRGKRCRNFRGSASPLRPERPSDPTAARPGPNLGFRADSPPAPERAGATTGLRGPGLSTRAAGSRRRRERGGPGTREHRRGFAPRQSVRASPAGARRLQRGPGWSRTRRAPRPLTCRARRSRHKPPHFPQRSPRAADSGHLTIKAFYDGPGNDHKTCRQKLIPEIPVPLRPPDPTMPDYLSPRPRAYSRRDPSVGAERHRRTPVTWGQPRLVATCFLLLLAVVVGATHLVYLRLLFFIHDRRKMRPARLVPAVSHDWTFHGPGATGQAAANWTAGFGRGPTPPALVGIRPVGPGRGARRLLVLEEFKTEKRLCKMFYAVTLLFLLLWGPYVVASYLRVLVRPGAVPQAYLTASVWLTFAQAGINPLVCFLFNRELRDSFRAQFPCCQSPRTTQATLPCDLKGIGL
ncbi:PREDICTED: probable G-protein coupled receptor 27 [Condylura cristata]|uniref:probable G-protein coupled receptor 27 n=1 Tax=Condylura cristata TaxID=143302 RepID=UPI0003346226|nr:PREDICTED: probable G-protein coupled receptor 27 [Condylura cristata]